MGRDYRHEPVDVRQNVVSVQGWTNLDNPDALQALHSGLTHIATQLHTGLDIVSAVDSRTVSDTETAVLDVVYGESDTSVCGIEKYLRKIPVLGAVRRDVRTI